MALYFVRPKMIVRKDKIMVRRKVRVSCFFNIFKERNRVRARREWRPAGGGISVQCILNYIPRKKIAHACTRSLH